VLLIRQTAIVSDEITDDVLDQMLARAEASLRSPWQSFVEGRDHFGGDSFIRTGGLDDASPDMYVTLSYWDDNPVKPATADVLDFIAAAREDVPRLVAEVRRLRGR
jgi:hypothetical protein